MSRPAVLLLNLGSPDSTSVPDVRRYLKEFLLDPRVIDAPWLVRNLVVRGLILPSRPKESAKAYAEIWTDEGSPLVVTSYQQRELLEKACGLPTYLAMRYGAPSIPDEIRKIKADGVTDLFVIPLYPQYAMSSYETVVVAVEEALRELAPEIKPTYLQPFYNDPVYIDTLVESAKPYLQDPYDRLLFSFHGIPERHLRKSDPSHAHCLTRKDCCVVCNPAHATCYRHQCLATVRDFIARAEVPEQKTFVSFQSRLGKDPWLQPYTDYTVEGMAKSGFKKVVVMTPAFVTDCLETLEEIAGEAREIFEGHGGEELRVVPCLNTHPAFLAFLHGKVKLWQENLDTPNGLDLAPPPEGIKAGVL